MKEENLEKYNFLKNKKFIYSAIVMITLFLYYEVRKDEDNLEKLKENNRIKNKQKENEINFENSKLLNVEINKENIKKLILSEKETEKNINENNQEEMELWKIETFFVTLFCAIYGGLYYYAYQEEKNTLRARGSFGERFFCFRMERTDATASLAISKSLMSAAS